MRRFFVVLCTLAVALIGLMVPAATADVGPAVTNCNSASGPGTQVSPVYIHWHGDDSYAAIGGAQLCRSGTSYWGYVDFYSTFTAPYWGQARLDRYHGSTLVASYTCDSAGGNGYVEPGQTQCWTPKISAGTSDTFQVLGYLCYGTTYPSCPAANLEYWGRTLLTR